MTINRSSASRAKRSPVGKPSVSRSRHPSHPVAINPSRLPSISLWSIAAGVVWFPSDVRGYLGSVPILAPRRPAPLSSPLIRGSRTKKIGSIKKEENNDNTGNYASRDGDKPNRRGLKLPTDDKSGQVAGVSRQCEKDGVLEATLLRRGEGSGLVLIAVARRSGAAKLAGLASIPARVMEEEEDQAAEIQASENLHRDNSA